MARKKYDTEALVGQLKAERRTGIVISSIAVVALFFLVGLYFIGSGDNVPPEIPQGTAADIAANRGFEAEKDAAAAETASAADAPTDAGTAEPATESGEEAPPSEELEEPEEPTPATGPASINIAMSRKGVLWIDGSKIGRLRKKSIELEAGEHKIRAKIGRRVVQQSIEVEAGAHYDLAVDGRRRRATLTKSE